MIHRSPTSLAGIASFFTLLAIHAQDGFFDDFDRPDGTDVGPGWNERVGNWEIHDGLLRPVQHDSTLEKLVSYDEIELEHGFIIEAELHWSVRSQWNGVAWNVVDAQNYYLFRIRADNGRVQAMKRLDGAFDPVFVNLGDNTVTIEPNRFYRLRVAGNGRGMFWWSVIDGDEVIADGFFTDDDPFEGGSSGLYSGRESIEADSFRLDTFNLTSEVPQVRTYTAVEVEFDTIDGIRYRLESSEDLEEWVETGENIEGDGGSAGRFFPARIQ